MFDLDWDLMILPDWSSTGTLMRKDPPHERKSH